MIIFSKKIFCCLLVLGCLICIQKNVYAQIGTPFIFDWAYLSNVSGNSSVSGFVNTSLAVVPDASAFTLSGTYLADGVNASIVGLPFNFPATSSGLFDYSAFVTLLSPYNSASLINPVLVSANLPGIATQIKASVFDNNLGYIAAGEYKSSLGATVNIGLLGAYNVSGSGSFVQKASLSGFWWKTLSGSIVDIAVDANDDIYILGGFTGTLTFSGSPLTLTSSGNSIFIAKYSASGTLLWVNQSSGGDAYPAALAVDFSQVYAVLNAANVNMTFSGTSPVPPTTFGSTNSNPILVTMDISTGLFTNACVIIEAINPNYTVMLVKDIVVSGGVVYLAGGINSGVDFAPGIASSWWGGAPGFYGFIVGYQFVFGSSVPTIIMGTSMIGAAGEIAMVSKMDYDNCGNILGLGIYNSQNNIIPGLGLSNGWNMFLTRIDSTNGSFAALQGYAVSSFDFDLKNIPSNSGEAVMAVPLEAYTSNGTKPNLILGKFTYSCP